MHRTGIVPVRTNAAALAVGLLVLAVLVVSTHSAAHAMDVGDVGDAVEPTAEDLDGTAELDGAAEEDDAARTVRDVGDDPVGEAEETTEEVASVPELVPEAEPPLEPDGDPVSDAGPDLEPDPDAVLEPEPEPEPDAAHEPDAADALPGGDETVEATSEAASETASEVTSESDRTAGPDREAGTADENEQPERSPESSGDPDSEPSQQPPERDLQPSPDPAAPADGSGNFRNDGGGAAGEPDEGLYPKRTVAAASETVREINPGLSASDLAHLKATNTDLAAGGNGLSVRSPIVAGPGQRSAHSASDVALEPQAAPPEGGVGSAVRSVVAADPLPDMPADAVGAAWPSVAALALVLLVAAHLRRAQLGWRGRSAAGAAIAQGR